MPITIKEITKADSVNAVGNIVFSYDIVDEKGVVIASDMSTISVSYDNADVKQIAQDLLTDAEAKEYEAKRKAIADKFDVALLTAEIQKLIAEKAGEVIG